MAAVTTERLMQIALEMAGWESIPGDCAIYYPGTRISHLLLGIDVGTSELFMARQLGYHAVIAHHPAGYAGPFWEVYRLHVGQMVGVGVPRDVAEAAVAARVAGFEAASQRENYDHVASVARLLETPFLNIHSPLDEVGRRIMQATVDAALAANPAATVADLRDALMRLPEFAAARTRMQVALGAWDAPAGRTVVSHGAYTNGGYHVARAYLTHGVDTICCIHFPLEDAQRLAAEGVRGNILVMGHIAGDSVGINPYVARLRADGLEVTTFSGVIGGQ
ncbi:MAG TPA: hypothetical protein VE338_03695 [Ktedonobacterales bacterium]|jgi:hypothetical protein|nr:hypothetical protein [Ktedonobacterales bacterium]